MPLCFTTSSGPANLLDPTYSAQTKCFALTTSIAGITLQLKVPLELDTSFNPQDYTIHFFKNTFLCESDIFQLFDAPLGVRLGWLIPIQALISDQHAEAKNQYFLRYATAAIYGLLTPSWNICSDRSDIIQAGEIFLPDFYSEDTAILALSNSVLANLARFRVEDYLPALFKHGYVCYDSSGHAAKAGSSVETCLRNLSQKLNCTPIAECLRGDPFLESLFSGRIDLKGHPLATFLLLYQVFELLIERVFHAERQNLLTKVNQTSSTVAEVKNAVHIMQDSIAEGGRLNRLCSAYFNASPKWDLLRAACDNFLKSLGKPSGMNLAEFLYPVRNTVVHEFRALTPTAVQLLDAINNELLVTIPEMMTLYKE